MGSITPGFICCEQVGYQLKVITVKTTGWTRLKKVLSSIGDGVVLAQERRLWESQVDGASA